MWIFGCGHSIFQLSWRSYHATTTAWFGCSCERDTEKERKGREEKDTDGKKSHRHGQIPRREKDEDRKTRIHQKEIDKD